MADDDRTDNVSIADSTNSKIVTITTDGAKERLDVNASFSPPSPNQGKYISVFLRNGGSYDLSVNGSGTPVLFTAGPPTGKRWYIHRMIIVARNGGISWANFLGETALSNGLGIDYDSGGVSFDLTDGEAIVRSFNLVRYGYDTEINTASVDMFRLRWTFAESGTVLDLNNTDSDLFTITVNDNLSGIIRFTTLLQGFEVDE